MCRWVLVHGIAGFGKTVLAAEAVRDATILEEVFPGKVCDIFSEKAGSNATGDNHEIVTHENNYTSAILSVYTHHEYALI